MKLVFGIVSLLIALAVVGLIAKQQMRAVAGPASPVAAAASGADGGTVQGRARGQAEQVQQDIQRALEQGRERNDRADQ